LLTAILDAILKMSWF